jgi:uncharacterized protein YkuJ
MADLQQLPPGLQRRQLLEIIEKHQANAWRKLHDAGVPESHVLALIPRIRSYCEFALNEYDQLYLACEEMSEREGRSVAHQRYFNDKLTFVLRSMETSIAEILAIAIRQPIEAAKHPPAREVITPPVYVPQSPPFLQTFLIITLKLLLWLCAFPASLLLGYQLTGSEWWQLLFPLVLLVVWILFRFSWWGMIFPVTILSTVSLLYLVPTAYQ